MVKVFPWEQRDPEKKHVEFADAQYQYMDFYGPYVDFVVEKNNKLKEIMATPVGLAIETAEVTMSDYDLLVKAAEELYDTLGEFFLKTNYFIVKIDSRKVDEIILNQLKEIRLF